MNMAQIITMVMTSNNSRWARAGIIVVLRSHVLHRVVVPDTE